MNISLYTADQEERLYIRREARTWARSGFITQDQLTIIDSRTDPGLNQTNVFFRILFFFFTSLCLKTVMYLFDWMVGFRSEVPMAWFALAFGNHSIDMASKRPWPCWA